MMDPLAHLRSLKARAPGAAPHPGDLTRIRALRFTQPGFDRATWRQSCARGWLGLCIPHMAGGSGRGVRRFCGVAEELGAGLAPEPLIAAAMAAVLLPAEHLPAVLAGERIVLPAWQETPGSLALAGATTLNEGRLDGRKLNVPMAAGADAFLVTVPGGLALVERDAPGLGLEIQPTPDGGNLATLSLDRTPAQPISGDPAPALEQTITATAAYLLGLADRAFAITQEHIKTADPFGGTGGSLQALRHRVDDMRVQLPLTRSVVHAAAAAMDEQGPLATRQEAASRAMLRASDTALTVTRACVHLHGGIGDIDAHDISLYFRKATVLAPLLGSAAAHRARCRRAAISSAG